MSFFPSCDFYDCFATLHTHRKSSPRNNPVLARFCALPQPPSRPPHAPDLLLRDATRDPRLWNLALVAQGHGHSNQQRRCPITGHDKRRTPSHHHHAAASFLPSRRACPLGIITDPGQVTATRSARTGDESCCSTWRVRPMLANSAIENHNQGLAPLRFGILPIHRRRLVQGAGMLARDRPRSRRAVTTSPKTVAQELCMLQPTGQLDLVRRQLCAPRISTSA